jgi:hypothetical protein
MEGDEDGGVGEKKKTIDYENSQRTSTREILEKSLITTSTIKLYTPNVGESFET